VSRKQKDPPTGPKKISKDELQMIREENEKIAEKQRNQEKCAHFGTSTREGVHLPEKTSSKINNKYTGAPGPGNYAITGDFDFRDPTKPDQRQGKIPKFCFGMKTQTRAKNLDMPGPGEYEVD